MNQQFAAGRHSTTHVDSPWHVWADALPSSLTRRAPTPTGRLGAAAELSPWLVWRCCWTAPAQRRKQRRVPTNAHEYQSTHGSKIEGRTLLLSRCHQRISWNSAHRYHTTRASKSGAAQYHATLASIKPISCVISTRLGERTAFRDPPVMTGADDAGPWGCSSTPNVR